MEWVETTGRSVEEAKEAALDQLGVDEHDAEFVLLSEPKPGLFGRMRGEARVRARVRPTSPRPKQARSRRSDQDRRGAKRSRAAGAQKGARSGSSAVSVVDRADESAVNGDGSPRRAAEGTAKAASSTAATTKSGTRTRRRSRSGGRRRGPGSEAAPDGREMAPAGTEKTAQAGSQHAKQLQSSPGRRGGNGSGAEGVGEEEGVGEDLSLEEQGESAREFIDGLVGMLGLEASVGMSVVDEDTVQVSVDGSELGILIGPGGGTLGALQELARTVVQRRTGGRSERILVDVAGYRAKRAAALQRFTQKIAGEVLSTGSERALEPMSAPDRKVVHDTVNEIDGVATRSVGEEPRRYIIIAPAQSESNGKEDG